MMNLAASPQQLISSFTECLLNLDDGLLQGAGWPFRAIRELQAGTLLAKDSDITVSPR